MNDTELKPHVGNRFDIASLGEVMLRLDPGEGRIHTTRQFNAWEGGGEYNVARGLARCFGRSATVITALADNPVGRLVEDLIRQGGVDTSYIHWEPYDGVGRRARNGLNFTERGFGPRAALGCSDRGHTAVSQLSFEKLPLRRLFLEQGVRILHTGGIFAALGDKSPDLASELMDLARRSGSLVSYDLNYRNSLWENHGGRERAVQVNSRLVEKVDVLFGNEEDFHAALGFEVEGAGANYSQLSEDSFRRMLGRVTQRFPHLKFIATSLRSATSASENQWGAVGFDVKKAVFHVVEQRPLWILDRVGGGDSFASGFLEGLLLGETLSVALSRGVAHGALAMSTPGDTTMATRQEVERFMKGKSARIDR